ncbi:MAG: hydrogenase maturation protease [Bryobacteraceae bacterium]|nr:hydrogenase maturation protease [Bryobacteraceae bacterium]
MTPLVIGCGNPDRGDDAAGILAARRLSEFGLPAIEHSGDGLALIAVWEGAADVIVVDAVITGAPPGTVGVWDARTAPPNLDAFRGSTHHFGVAEAIGLAGALGRLPPRLIIVGIEAAAFDLGAPVSAAVRCGIDEAVRRIVALAGQR